MNFTWRYPDSTLSHGTDVTFLIDYICKVFIENEFFKLKRKKSIDVDELPPCMLKNCASEMSKRLHHIINLSIKTSVVPSTWKIANIIAYYLNQGLFTSRKLSPKFNFASIV